MLIDAIILGVLLVSAVFAFLRGFIRETLTILGVVGGLAASLAFGKQLVPLMSQWIGVDKNAKDPQLMLGIVPYTVVADVLAYGSIFLIVVIVLSIISNLLAKGARTLGLGPIDRTLGVIFGIARGVLVLAVLYLLPYLLFPEDTRKEWFKDSRTIVYIESTAAWLSEFLPDSVKNTTPSSAADSANSMAKATRDKLKDLELLNSDEPVKEETVPAEDGYETDQRQNMQELIQEQSDEQPGELTDEQAPPPMPAPVTPTPVQPGTNVNE